MPKNGRVSGSLSPPRYFWGAMRIELTVRQREEERERGGPPFLYIAAWDAAEISRVVVPKSQPPSHHRGRETESERKNTQRGGKNQTKGLVSLGDASRRKRHRRWESDSSTAPLPKIHLFKRTLMCKVDTIPEGSAPVSKEVSRTIPPLPGPVTNNFHKGLSIDGSPQGGYSCVSTATKDSWERLFDEGYRADVSVNTDDGGIINAHANILGMASPVMKGLLKQSSRFCRQRSISILGAPHDAVRIFIRFLYSSCYEKKEMEEFAVHLLVLSHVYLVPQLKQECQNKLEHGLLTTENVVDIFQLALLCDAPRLSLICHRMIVKNFKTVCTTEGWKVMKKSHPALEKELVESMIEEDNRQKERIKKVNERKIYLLLYEAMEALVHIYKDGCRTIGPSDKDFKENQAPCKYVACKGLELLVRHFAGCKLRAPGGCIHCKRMWQLLELHYRLCADSHTCRVPLCRSFKERIKKQSKKDEIRWKMLVKKILTTKRIAGAPFISSAMVSSLWQ